MKLLTLALLAFLSVACLKQSSEEAQQDNKQTVTRDPITGRTVVSGSFDVPVKIQENNFTVLRDTSRKLTYEGRECEYEIKKGSSTYDIVDNELIFSSNTRLTLISATTRGTIYGSWLMEPFESEGFTKSFRFTFSQKMVKKKLRETMSVKMACSY